MIRRRDRKRIASALAQIVSIPLGFVLDWRAFIYCVSVMAFGLASTRSRAVTVRQPRSKIARKIRVHSFVHSARDQAMRSVERVVDQCGARYAMPTASTTCCATQDTPTAVVYRWIAATGDPDYRDAFLTILKDPMTGHRDLINVRSRGAQGDATASRTCDVCRYGVGCGSGVPIDLDPTILSTGLAGLNQIGDVANVRTTVFGG